MGGTCQALKPPSKRTKREGMAGDKGSLALESEAGSIESAEEGGARALARVTASMGWSGLRRRMA